MATTLLLPDRLDTRAVDEDTAPAYVMRSDPRIVREGTHNPLFGLRLGPNIGPSLRASPEQGAQHRVEACGTFTPDATGACERTRSVRK